ncbi:MAG: uracil-DNA glycosylase [Gammaproteobacteria bacterium]|nr:uracil-DNA glycosylase [Gammaproteobacteria bacterium]MYD76879.1 uracil-DNA glycosylase [Gammaproteobacteria bacterium]MYJ51998.1 uracil-DNA glycosylase [Gammaproteobacteria bacterium]
MVLPDHRRTRILDQIGIQVWRSRDAGGEDSPVTASEESRVAAPVDPVNSTEQEPDRYRSLEDISAKVLECQRCPLHTQRKRAVPGTGNPDADWMFVGEAPGREEDIRGLPFVGRAGQLLDSMILALGLSRDQVYIANTIKCRPPNNRDPSPEEVRKCESYLKAQIGMIQPRVIVALGRISAHLLLKTPDSVPMRELRGQVHQHGPTGTPLVVTYHPAYLLRSPDQKARAWEDLLLARLQLK